MDRKEIVEEICIELYRVYRDKRNLAGILTRKKLKEQYENEATGIIDAINHICKKEKLDFSETLNKATQVGTLPKV